MPRSVRRAAVAVPHVLVLGLPLYCCGAMAETVVDAGREPVHTLTLALPTESSVMYLVGDDPDDMLIIDVPPMNLDRWKVLASGTRGKTSCSNKISNPGRSASPVNTAVAGAGTSSLGDYVWHDIHGDGIQDDGEPGLAGVEIKLRSCRGGNYLQTTYSDSNGNYLFANLASESYLVQFIMPDGMTLSPMDQGTEGKDSDANLLGLSGCSQSRVDEQRLGEDAGIQ